MSFLKVLPVALLSSLLAACNLVRLPSAQQPVGTMEIDPALGDLNTPAAQQSAERNFTLAQAHQARKTPEDDKSAVTYYLAAAEQGNTDAQARLGALLLAGRGVEANPKEAARWLRNAAKEGVVDAQSSLGAMYEHGIGVEPNSLEAEKWYLLAAKRQHAEAMLGLVRIYRLRPSTKAMDFQKEAFNWATRAAALGEPEADYRLAEFYESGVGTARDIPAARKHYERAAQAGYADAYLALAHMYAQEGMEGDIPLGKEALAFEEGSDAVMRAMQYELGEGMPVDLAQAQALYEEAAAKGDSYAAFRAGRLLEQRGQAGRKAAVPFLEQAAEGGVVAAHVALGRLHMLASHPDWTKIFYHFQKAATQGNPFAQYMLSILYRHPPHGFKEDLVESVHWYQKAQSASGQAYAQYEIAGMYSEGQGFERNLPEAFRWYLRAGEKNVTEAQLALGHLYLHGKGVQRDFVEAANWYKRAAVGGSPAAKYFLGLMYFNGQGFDRVDHKTAAQWFTLAAKERYAPAQYRLATMYFEGDGVHQSDVEAFAWWSLCAQGHFEARIDALDVLINRMTPSEMQKAVAKAAAYKAAYASEP